MPETSSAGEFDIVDGRRLAGTVRPSAAGDPTEVAICLNRTEVVRLPLIESPREAGVLEFHFKVRRLLQFARGADRLTVRYAGAALPFVGTGEPIYRPRQQGTLPTWQLRRRLARGEILNSDGVLQRPKDGDVEWQRGVLGLYDEVRQALRETSGYDAFLIYGSLLGAVREGDFIGHDTDLDAGYVSAHTNGPDAGRELADIAVALVGRGLRVECRVIVLHVYAADDPDVHIDLFHTFFDEDGILRFPWGVAGTSDYRREDWHGVEPARLAGQDVLLPSRPEIMAEAMYGAGWRHPDPGFSWARERVQRAGSGRVPAKRGSAANWISHWQSAGQTQPSSFARVCLGRQELPRTILDLGCGDGVDSAAFAAAGRVVVGLDSAPNAISRARERVSGHSARFEVVDFDDEAALRQAMSEARGDGGTLLFFGHWLLDSLFDDTAASVLDVIGECSLVGDAVAFASRTTFEGKQPLRHRRPVDSDALTKQLGKCGFAVLHDVTWTPRPTVPVHELIARRES